VVREAPLEQTEHGLRPGGPGWFVLNLREACWFDRGLGLEAGISGSGDFPQVGIGISVLRPGDPMAMYHWESDQEGFLVLAGGPLAIVEGEERRLRAWDFVHCPPGTPHVLLGAGERPAVILAVGARQNHVVRLPDGTTIGAPDGGAYAVEKAAIRHGAGVREETADPAVAYAGFPEPKPMRYQEGLLP
jgi:uncharacterized cupin superfamily protein